MIALVYMICLFLLLLHYITIFELIVVFGNILVNEVSIQRGVTKKNLIF